jgi:dipeptidyl aminopeptidase/acylaminoacyl peptidase
MQSKFFFKQVLISACLLSLSLSACLPEQAGIISTATPLLLPTESLSTAMPSPSTPPLPIDRFEVAFVKDGSIQVWDAATQQAQTIVNTGDVLAVTMSDDGQTIAFTRGSWVGDVPDGYEQFALWAVNRDGGNLRELIAAQDLRQRINPSERDSSNFYQLGWVPQSHLLIFSGTKYIVQAEGLSHAVPQGAYLVDTDKGSVTVLAEAAENLRFLPSPDGMQIALMSPNGVGFINVESGNRSQAVLTYAEAGRPGPLFPTGVWTLDSGAFVMTGSFEYDPSNNVNFTIWLIRMDGSSPEILATVKGSHPSSVTFSPDGKSASFLQTKDEQPTEIAGWSITALTPEAGPLALPYNGKEASYANLHWSPAGDAFVIKDQDLLQLCPDATQDSQVCGQPIHLGSGIITALQWVDSSRFLMEGIEPNTLSLGNLDGTITPIVTWTELQRYTENDIISGWSFYIPR